jgi:hypothetical protein
MGYTFARVSAAGTLRVEDYFQQGRRSWLRLHEKGGKRHESALPSRYSGALKRATSSLTMRSPAAMYFT